MCIRDSKYIESRVAFGVKIARDRETGDIEILNTSRGGDYYQEITKNEYDNFFKNGRRYGVYVVSLSNYRRKLEVFDEKIKEAISNSAPKKELNYWHERRKNTMNKYTKVTNKLNLSK